MEYLENTSRGLGMGEDGDEPVKKPRFSGLAVGEFPICPHCKKDVLREVSPQNNNVLACTYCTKMFDEIGDGTIKERGV